MSARQLETAILVALPLVCILGALLIAWAARACQL